MAASNFQQWNPNESNQESDSAYTGDSLRSGGAPVNAIFPSATANKLFYQVSTMVAALANYLVGQGQNASDTNLATLSAAIQAAIAAQIAAFPNIVNVPYSISPVFDATQGTTFFMLLTGNVTSSVLSPFNTGSGGVYSGRKFTFILVQDNTGGHTFAWPSDAGAPSGRVKGDPISGVANSVNVQEFVAVGPENNVLYPIATLKTT